MILHNICYAEAASFFFCNKIKDSSISWESNLCVLEGGVCYDINLKLDGHCLLFKFK